MRCTVPFTPARPVAAVRKKSTSRRRLRCPPPRWRHVIRPWWLRPPVRASPLQSDRSGLPFHTPSRRTVTRPRCPGEVGFQNLRPGLAACLRAKSVAKRRIAVAAASAGVGGAVAAAAAAAAAAAGSPPAPLKARRRMPPPPMPPPLARRQRGSEVEEEKDATDAAAAPPRAIAAAAVAAAGLAAAPPAAAAAVLEVVPAGSRAARAAARSSGPTANRGIWPPRRARKRARTRDRLQGGQAVSDACCPCSAGCTGVCDLERG
jgi:hypothetical protein